MNKTREEILELFALQVAAWAKDFPAEAGVIRARVCAALKFSDDEFRNWVATARDAEALKAVEESIEADAAQEETDGTVIEGEIPAASSASTASEELPAALSEGSFEFKDDGKSGGGWLDRRFPELLMLVASKSGSKRVAGVGYLFLELARHSHGRDAAAEALVRDEVLNRLPELKKADYERCMREARARLRAEKSEGAEAAASEGDASDWGGLAKKFLIEYENDCALVFWRETWFEWRKDWGYYRKKGRKWMTKEATLWMHAAGLNIDKRSVENFVNAVQAFCYLEDDVEAPCWLRGVDGKIRRNGSLYLSMRNGILDVESVKMEMDDQIVHAPLIAHTRDFFTLNALAYEFQPDATCPGLESAIAQWQPKDERDPDGLGQRLLQDWAGYILEPGQPHNVMLLNQGQGNDGKSQYRELCTAIAGVENTSTLGLEALDPSQQYGREDLLGKTLWTIPDANQIEKMGEGTLKAITGGDRVNIPRKWKDSVNGPLNAKVMMSCNEYPGFRDRSEGIWRRILMLQWFPVANVIPNFAAKLIAEEMPGIFIWALRGWWRVRQSGFTRRGLIAENVLKIRRETQQELSFFDECVEIVHEAEGEGVSNNKLIRAYIDWCRLNNVKPYAHPETMGRALVKWVRWELERSGDVAWTAAAIAEFTKDKNFKKRRMEDGKQRTWFYVKIRLLVQDEAERVEMQGGYSKGGRAQTAPVNLSKPEVYDTPA